MRMWSVALAFALFFAPLAGVCQAAGGSGATSREVTPTAADPRVHRLILKDGSYQSVSKYEIRHDRVRYISAERGGDWEELPVSLVDWAATEKYAGQHANDGPVVGDASGKQEAAAIDAEEKADRNRDLLVAPDLRLPDETGVWALDSFHDEPELAELEQNSGNINRQSGHNLTRSALNATGGTKQTIEMNGRHAKVNLHLSQPVFYISVDQDADEPSADALTVDTHGASAGKTTDSGSAATSQYVIVRVEVRKEYRFIGLVKPGGSDPNVIATKSELLDGKRWMKVTPKEPLQAGDYALMEVLSPKEVNMSVWDFRVDPNGPDNDNAVLPVHRYVIAH